MTIVFGLVLYLSDKFKLKKIKDHFSIKSAIIIGLFKYCISSGTSRSGVQLQLVVS